MNTTLPEDVTTSLLAIGAPGWIADLSDGHPNDRTRVSMYMRFIDEKERGEQEHHGGRSDLLAAYAAARTALWGLMVTADVLAERERCAKVAESLRAKGGNQAQAIADAIRSGEG